MPPNRPPTIINGKYALLWLINHYGVSMISLAQKSEVEVGEIHKMVKGEVVEQGRAERVLKALSKVVGIKYTLKEVHIKIGGADVYRTS